MTGKYEMFLLVVAALISSMAASSSIKVTLSMYSGRQDPVWIFHQGDPQFVPLAAILDSTSSTHLPSKLGYRGFTIEKLADMSVISEGVLTVCSRPALESTLLAIVKALPEAGSDKPLDAQTVQYVEDTIALC